MIQRYTSSVRIMYLYVLMGNLSPVLERKCAFRVMPRCQVHSQQEQEKAGFPVRIRLIRVYLRPEFHCTMGPYI